MLVFVGFYKRYQYFQSVPFGRIGLSVKKAVYLFQCSLIVLIGFNGFNIHTKTSHTVWQRLFCHIHYGCQRRGF